MLPHFVPSYSSYVYMGQHVLTVFVNYLFFFLILPTTTKFDTKQPNQLPVFVNCSFGILYLHLGSSIVRINLCCLLDSMHIPSRNRYFSSCWNSRWFVEIETERSELRTHITINSSMCGTRVMPKGKTMFDAITVWWLQNRL